MSLKLLLVVAVDVVNKRHEMLEKLHVLFDRLIEACVRSLALRQVGHENALTMVVLALRRRIIIARVVVDLRARAA